MRQSTSLVLLWWLSAYGAQAHYMHLVLRSAEGEKVSPISGMFLSTPSTGSGFGEPRLRAVQPVYALQESPDAFLESTWGVYRNEGASLGRPCDTFPCNIQKTNCIGNCFGMNLRGEEDSPRNGKHKPLHLTQRESAKFDWTIYNWGKAERINKEHASNKTPPQIDDEYYSRLAYLGYKEQGKGGVELFWPKAEVRTSKWWHVGKGEGFRYLTFTDWGLMVHEAALKNNEYEEYDFDMTRPLSTPALSLYACYPEQLFTQDFESKTLPIKLFQQLPTVRDEHSAICDKVTIKARITVSQATNFGTIWQELEEKKQFEQTQKNTWKQFAKWKNQHVKAARLKKALRGKEPITEVDNVIPDELPPWSRVNKFSGE